MFVVYVLYSSVFDKIYIGYTSDLEKRFASHNLLGKTGWTVRFRPWNIAYTEQFHSKADAMKREKELKSAKGREFVWREIRKKNY